MSKEKDSDPWSRLRRECGSQAAVVAKCQMQKLAGEVYLALRCTDACA